MGVLLSIARRAATSCDVASRGHQQGAGSDTMLVCRLGAPASGIAEASPHPAENAFDCEYFAERAAIRQYDGGYTRQEAERLALADLNMEGLNDGK